MPALLSSRQVLAVTGADRVLFLQGLVSNDVTLCAPGHAVWSAFLSPQGKWLSDFFIFSDSDRLLLDVPSEHADMLTQRLTRFRLRSDVAIARADLHVVAGWGDEEKPEHPLAARDPRLIDAGWRALVAVETGDAEHLYHAHRLPLGLPDAADCEPDRTLLLEANFDALAGVSWTKGCYMGQELTARTHYRGLVRRRLTPVEGENLPEIGAELTLDGKSIGTMRSQQDGRGLAFIRTEAWDKTLTCENGSAIHQRRPAWLVTKERNA